MLTKVSEFFSDYNWKEAFQCAGVSTDDVAAVLAYSDGENDGDSWLGVFRRMDGQFMFVTAWCDYTGWGCQDGGDATIRADLDTLIYNDIGEADRERLGYPRLRPESA